MDGSQRSVGESNSRERPLVREVLPSKSAHVQLALVHVPGPVHLIEPAPYWRLSFNIGRPFVLNVTGDAVRERFDLERHALMIIPPGEHFAHRASEPQPPGRRLPPGRLATFRISPALAQDSARAAGLRPRDARLGHKVVPTDDVLRLQAQALLCDLESGNPDGATATERTAAALVARLQLRESREQEVPAALDLERVKAHVSARLATPLTLDELAAVAGVSLFHFCRVFRKVLGITPHRYILEQRIAEAQRLLWAERGMSILQVALACGFASPSHFAAQFKRHTGQTPLQWRRDH